MIVSADIASILARDARSLGISAVYGLGTHPASPLTEEYIRIAVQPLKTDVYWNIAEASVDIYVPDAEGQAALTRLTALERSARSLLGVSLATYDGTSYRYAIDSSCLQADPEHACHFINIQIKFKVLNTKN